MRYCLTVSALIISSVITTALSQGTVEGVVSDNSTGEPIPGVYVIFRNNAGTSTDNSGFYSVTMAPDRKSVV